MWLSKIIRQKRGAVAVMVGLSIVVLFGFAALVVDLGYALVARNQLHNAADASALAASRHLGQIYIGMTAAEQQAYVLTSMDEADIKAQAINVAALNYAAGVSLSLNDADIEIGTWDAATRTFTPATDQPDAVRVTARRDGTENGPISTFFARILGRNSMNVMANATAALTGLGEVYEGELDLPVGIDKYLWNSPDACGTDIIFYPTGTDSCAGWTTFDQTPSSASTLRGMVDGMREGTYQAPPLVANADGATVEFIGGNVASALPNLRDLFDAKKTMYDEYGQPLPEPYWDAMVVVYDDGDAGCSNVSGANQVAGFAKIRITQVLAPPDGQLIEGTVTCENMEDGRGGGSNLGVVGSIPKLVQ